MCAWPRSAGRAPSLPGGTWTLGDLTVTRFGYGAMQLAGPWVMGPPADRDAALAVLREAVDLGITSRRPEDLRRQVHENLRSLQVDVLDLVNLRMGKAEGPRPGSLAGAFSALLDLQQEGLVRHLGLSNVTSEQVTEAQGIAPIACVQNLYNLAHRHDDDLVDRLPAEGVAYVPFFPLGGFTPLQSAALSEVARRRGATPMSVALAWLLQRSPNLLLIAGTSSVAHLRENVAGAGLTLSSEDVAELDAIGG